MLDTDKASNSETHKKAAVGTMGGRFILTMIAGFYLLCIGQITYGLWDQYQYKQVVASENAGSIISAAYQNPSFNAPTTAITTEKGTWVVIGVMQGISGHQVRLETRGNRARALCDDEAGVCKMIYPEDGHAKGHNIGFFVMMLIIMTLVLGLTYAVLRNNKGEGRPSVDGKEGTADEE